MAQETQVRAGVVAVFAAVDDLDRVLILLKLVSRSSLTHLYVCPSG